MPHYTPLITTIVAALTLAWAFAAVAHRLRLPPIVGYLLAGIAIGPFTPGYVADQNLAGQLAEIGVILLMFGVGLHFSLEDLLSVRKIAIPGAIAQILCATLLGMGLGLWLGWPIGEGLVFGLALSVASTVVLLRALQERHLVETERGRIAVGWLIVEDIAMVLTLVLLPVIAGLLTGAGGRGDASLPEIALALGLAAAKIAAFVAVMLIVGKRVIPWILHSMAHTGSRELFRLSVLVIALGTAFGAAELFGVSFALGAFFAGMILSESKLSHQAATETLPLRDAFAVLFFVSVGMLFDPMVLGHEPVPLVATLLIILIGKSLAAFAIVRAFGYSNSTALTVAAALAQIGEFSFILANLGVDLALLSEQGRDLVLAGAIISILLNPLLFSALDRLLARVETERGEPAHAEGAEDGPREEIRRTRLENHVVLIGHGRVGRVISQVLRDRNEPLLVIDDDEEEVAELTKRGIAAIAGNAADPEVIQAANLRRARFLLVAIPDAFEGGQVVQQARAINPNLPIIARAHSEEEIGHLKRHGANTVVMGEHEIAKSMLDSVAAARARVDTAVFVRSVCERLSDAPRLDGGRRAPIWGAGCNARRKQHHEQSSRILQPGRAGRVGGRKRDRRVPSRSWRRHESRGAARAGAMARPHAGRQLRHSRNQDTFRLGFGARPVSWLRRCAHQRALSAHRASRLADRRIEAHARAHARQCRRRFRDRRHPVPRRSVRFRLQGQPPQRAPARAASAQASFAPPAALTLRYLAAASVSASSSVKTRLRVRKRTPSGASTEKPCPRPGTTSMMSWVCFQ